MEQYKGKYKNQLYLGIVILSVTGFYMIRNGFLGSSTDWINQHTVFPDYFRSLFYATGNLFPNYAANIGGGQNIYNFSYYGFLNPVIMISYLLPHVRMTSYIMAVSLISLAAATILFYKWLRAKGFSDMITLSVSAVFLLAAPMLYHTYKQILFVNYMPFLCMALIGTDRYFQTGRRVLLTVSVFMIFMSSFYFSIGAVTTVILYGIYLYSQGNRRFRIRTFLQKGRGFAVSLAVAFFMSGILLIPTLAPVLESHRMNHTALPLSELLIPKFTLLQYVYSPYGIGLSAIAVTVLLAGFFYREKSTKILTAGIVLIFLLPVFLYIFNGGLYARYKALIPFLPLLCYMYALFFRKLENSEMKSKLKMLPFFIAAVLVTLPGIKQTQYWFLAFADAVFMLFCYLRYLRTGKLKTMLLPIVIIMLAVVTVIQLPGNLLSKEKYDEIFGSDISRSIAEAADTGSSRFRTETLLNKRYDLNRTYSADQYITSAYSSCYQSDYYNFRKNIFQVEEPYSNCLMQSASEDPLFLKFMGVRNVWSDFAPTGYHKTAGNSSTGIYVNENVIPEGYVTDQLIPISALRKAVFPYRQELLLDHAFAGKGTAEKYCQYKGNLKNFRSAVTETSFVLPESAAKDLTVKKNNGIYYIKAKKTVSEYIPLPETAESDHVLFLEMKVKNLRPSHRLRITIHGEQNTLSARSSEYFYYNGNTVFRYALSVKKGCRYVKATFGKGNYTLSSLKSYSLPASALTAEKNSEGIFRIEKVTGKSDEIIGTVKAGKDGFFVTSIPFDRNFRITVDGKSTKYTEVNGAFIGFPISEGYHNITFRYISPGFLAGEISSIAGFVMLILMIVSDRKKKKNIIDKDRGDIYGK